MAIREEQWKQMVNYIGSLDAAAPSGGFKGEFAGAGSSPPNAESLRRTLRNRVGYPPPGFDAAGRERLEKIGEDDLATYYRCRVAVSKQMDCYGLYIVPKQARFPAPLVIAQHGGGGFPELALFRGGANYHDLVRGPLRRGWIVFAPHHIFYPYGDRDHGTPLPKDVREQLDRQLRQHGTSLAAVEVAKISRALDALLQRPEVDPGRVAMAGLSFGGYYSLYAAALEPRIQAVVASCSFVQWGEETANSAREIQNGGKLCDLSPAELAALICPRPLQVQSGTKDDLLALEKTRPQAALARDTYTKQGAGNRFAFEAFEGGHEFKGDLAWAFLDQHLKAAQPPRLRRADSFLGIHFDFHAGKDCTEIGKNTTRRMIEYVIDQVRPDYLQIDCKGHAGFSSYPTKVGNPAPGFVGGDPLCLWRQVTAERGISLYMHYSGVWDSEAIRLNPSWAVINADGKVNGNATSFFGPYADRLLAPQLRELAGDYGVDGAWVDGECWASAPDYGEAALKAFRETTGITSVPRKPGDPNWFEFLEFNRENFRRYLRHYITEVKKTNPEFQLCSNWAFTDHMPEAVCAPVDFLSGDYSPEDSVNSARISARYLARQGKPWDLMAWSFTHKKDKNGSNLKTAVQLQREAAAVLALGGGFQAYFTQKRDGSIREERMPVMAEVGRFCRARQKFCHHAEQVPQVALLYSTPAHYRNVNGLFSRDHSGFAGTLNALLESRQSVELLGEHHLQGRLSEYPLVIVPEWGYLDTSFKAELLAYVKAGGNLLLIGPRTAALFESELGVKLEGEPQQLTRYLEHGGTLTPMKGLMRTASLGGKAEAFGVLHVTNDLGSASMAAASIMRHGKGRIAATYFGFSRNYLTTPDPLSRQFLNDLARRLFPKPMVEVEGSGDVDLVVNRIQGRLAVNLVNTSGPHEKEPILESISPVGPLTLKIRQPKRPSSVTLEPAGQRLDFQYRRGVVRLTVPRVDIHEIVVVQ
jgi:dienelactone hydrolase